MKWCADASFLIDVSRGDIGAAAKLREMQLAGEVLQSPAPAVAELLLGAYLHTGKAQTEALTLAEEIETIPIEFETAAQAARIAAALIRAGKPLPMVDILIAAAALSNNLALLSRDQGFDRIEGLVVERY
jgi:tRNA(fMet)-specific endonuclease VapC